jgi:hypothetical protein
MAGSRRLGWRLRDGVESTAQAPPRGALVVSKFHSRGKRQKEKHYQGGTGYLFSPSHIVDKRLRAMNSFQIRMTAQVLKLHINTILTSLICFEESAVTFLGKR